MDLEKKMRHFIIIEQRVDNVEVVQSSDLELSLQDVAIRRSFPSGSDWSKFIQARSFRFSHLANDYYQLSYTLVLGHAENVWDGTLRSWALIDTREAFLSEKGLGKHDPQQLFRKYKKLFNKDPFYSHMIKGLTPPLNNMSEIEIPFFFKLLYRFSVKSIFSSPFVSRSKWVPLESALYKHWHEAMKGSLRKRKPITFTTLTLSKFENTHLKGIPSSR